MKLKTLSIITILLLALTLPAVSAALPEDAVPVSKQVLHIPNKMSGSYLDVMKTMYNRVGYPTIVQESLTAFDKNYEAKPGAGAARDWEVSNDKLTWTFYLQQDLKWSDGTSLTADDFIFALQRAIKQGYDFSWYYSWAADIKNWGKVESGELPIEKLGIKAIDDHIIQVTTNSVKPFLPSVLTWWYPVPEHVVEKHGDKYATKAETLVCSGPYKVSEWVKGEKIVYTPNPEYQGAWKPYLQKIVEMVGTGNAEVGFNSYLSGQLDVSQLNPGQLKYVKNRIPEQLESWPKFQMFYLSMDTSKKPFTKTKVRNAIALAIDREKLANTALKDLIKPVTTMIMPGYPGYNEELEGKIAYDPERAKELLAEAGYPGGEDFPTITLLVRNEDAIMHIQKPLAQYVQNQLKENLGINMEIKILEMKTWYSQLTNREHDFFLSPYSKDFFEPSNFLGLFTDSGREPWSDEKYNKLIKEGSTTMDKDKRFEIYNKAEDYFLDKTPGVPLAMQIYNEVWKPYLQGEAVTPNKKGLVTKDDVILRYWFTHVYIGENN